MDNDLNASNQNLQCSFFSESDLKRVKLLRQFAKNVTELLVKTHSEIRIANTIMKLLYIGKTSFKLF